MLQGGDCLEFWPALSDPFAPSKIHSAFDYSGPHVDADGKQASDELVDIDIRRKSFFELPNSSDVGSTRLESIAFG